MFVSEILMGNSTVASALEGKVVVLTGGGDGIGRECALAYARAKATVAILDVNLTAARLTAEELGSLGIAIARGCFEWPLGGVGNQLCA